MENPYYSVKGDEPFLRADLVENISQLKNIIWMVEAVREISTHEQEFKGLGIGFNHSLPIMAATPSFSPMRHDLRAIGPELKFVLSSTLDPRDMRWRWKKLLKRWHIRDAPAIRKRVL